MPQAKKGKFQVIGKFIDAKGEPVRPGNIVDLEVDEDGKPVNSLIASRVRPFTGSLPTGGDTGEADRVLEEAHDVAERIVKDAKKDAEELREEGKKDAKKLVDDAREEASKIIDEAGKAAEKIIEDAGKTTKK